MKRLLTIFLLLPLLVVPAWAADQKVTAMTNLATLTTGDELYCVDDPGGTPLKRACTIDVIATFIQDTFDASSELLAIMDDETGTGALCFATAPTFTTSITLASSAATEFDLTGAEDAIDFTMDGGIRFDLDENNDSVNNFRLRDGTDTSVFIVSELGLVTVLDGLDGIGAVDMDYGSADVTDHTFTTDGTGDAEFVVPDDSIGANEIGALPADAVDAITEIAAGLKAGADTTLLTGTAGTSGHCGQWNADGDLVTTGAACGGAPATADISDVSVTQTELAELETIDATTISVNQWAVLGGIAETLTFTELNLLDGITVLSGSNTGDDDQPEAGDYAAASIDGDDVNSNIAGRSLGLTAASPDTLDADPELYTFQKCVTVEDPVTDEEWFTVWRAPVAATLTEIYCEVTGGTSVLADFEVDDGTPTGVNGSDLTCSTAGVTDSSLAGDTSMAAGDRLDVDTGTVTGSVTQISLCIKGTFDD